MNNSFVSIKVVLDNILDHPLLQDVTLERAVVYAAEFIRLLGVPDCYEDKIDTVEVKDHIGYLPEDTVDIIQIRDAKTQRMYNYTSSSFHGRDSGDDFTYKRQGNVVVLSTKETEVEIAYRAMVLDEFGFPMIPDAPSVTRALELYIKNKRFTILFDQGKISGQALANNQSEYGFAVQQARNHLLNPTVDEWESISNNMNSMLPRTRAHATGYRYLSNKEVIKIH
jgi:hypothetical protein